jgi:hypothetical protein
MELNKRKSMRIAILICCIIALVFLSLIDLSYIMGIPSEVSITGIDNGVIIQNVGNHPCLVIANSIEGEQQFELAVGANVTLVTLSNITGTTGVLAFGSTTVRVDLVHLFRPADGWPGIKCKVSSNFTDP